MNLYLLNRSLGSISPRVLERAHNTRLLHALQPTNVQFSSSPTTDGGSGTSGTRLAHPSGVNSIAIDRFEGRYLLSGGADSSIGIWDLEAEHQSDRTLYKPLGYVEKTSTAHRYGITHLSFYPFDSLAFLSSSYDHTLKLYSSETLTASATFTLNSVIYSHAVSTIASHLLVACATQHPAIRLVDLRSGASTHSLAGHSSSVLTTQWSPTEEHILASGGSDGTVRFWDIRRSAGGLGVLDMEDSIGVTGLDGLGTGARSARKGKAHSGAVNGLVWTDDGRHLVTAGLDERIRVWDMATGANTLASFGPTVKNSHLSTLLPLIAPSTLVPPKKEVLFFPSEREVLVYELFEGRLLKRLRTPAMMSGASTGGGQRNLRNRTTALAWRAHDVELYSAHADGSIRAWKPRTSEDALAEDEEQDQRAESDADEEGTKKRKREVLDEVYRELMGQKITFS